MPEKLITYRGKTQNMKKWARELGINYGTFRARFYKGLDLDRVFSSKLLINKPGDGCITPDGYRVHRKNKKNHLEHRLFAEKILGKPLPKTAVIHHINGDRLQHKGNLIICESLSYHRLLHEREKAVKACGNPAWRMCCYCHQYDDLKHMIKQGQRGFCHQICRNARARRDNRRRRINGRTKCSSSRNRRNPLYH